ncbi:hypothetical protein B296_00040277 [Ensete ventricosum]|uniref:Gnk2-homologous domain-containing protein n=1 Tax=Ensete ventricosum TaxID=4639 RepID=A0A426YQC0_ENSVE|nr:hypothetical protein B296_00040277 [Ensete ventricosum]
MSSFALPTVAGAICTFIVPPSTMATSVSISPLFLLAVLCFSSSPAMAQPLYQVCDQTGNYTANSTYKSNLDLLLSSLASNGSLSGFYNGTAGRSPDQVSGIVLCRGDVATAGCSSCLATAGQVLLQLCPNKGGATVWYDDCLLRYSNNQSFFSSTDNSPMAYLVNEKDIPEVSRFDKLMSELMSGIADRAAASNGSSKKFATGTMSNFTSELPTIYGLVQCTPDLSTNRCRQCLQKLFDVIPNLFEGKRGARAVGVRCNMRYEVYSFYQSTPTLRLTAPPASGGSGGSGQPLIP